MNTFTSTNKMTLYVEDAMNRVIPVTYHLVIRAYATKPMIEETLTHFRFATALMAAGIEWSHDIPRCHDLEETTIWCEDAPMPTEAAVQIFTNEFPVWSAQAKGCIKIPLNIFTEYTSAFEVWDTMSMIVDLLPGIREIDETLKPEQPQRQQPAQQAPADLDDYFPRDEAPKPMPPLQPPPQTTPATDGDSPHLGAYDYKIRAQYLPYAGQTVSFDIRRMIRRFDSRDASPYIEVYSSYNGGTSKYPAHDLKVKKARLEKVDEATAHILLQVMKDGNEIHAPFRGVFFMFKPDDKNYCIPCLVKLEAVGTHPDYELQDTRGDEQRESYEERAFDDMVSSTSLSKEDIPF